jgi:hypothetical protein
MFSFLDKIDYLPLALLALFMGLAPFSPMPHSLEKISMLFRGELVRPVDIFDLFFHLAPLILVIIKFTRKLKSSSHT